MLFQIALTAHRKVDRTIHRPHEDQQRHHINDPEQRLPIQLQLPPPTIDNDVFVPPAAIHAQQKLRDEAPRREVEAHGDDGKEPEAGELDADADQRDDLAEIEFEDGVGGGDRHGGDDQRADELQEERDWKR